MNLLQPDWPAWDRFPIERHATTAMVFFCRTLIERSCSACTSNHKNLANVCKLPPQAAIAMIFNGTSPDDLEIIFETRSKRPSKHPGEVSFPGGMLDIRDNGDIVKCAIRETIEEIGFELKRDEHVGNLGVWTNRKANIPVCPVVFYRPEKILVDELVINREEVDSVFSVPIRTLLSPEVLEFRNMRSGWPPVPFFTVHGHPPIWGFTGFCLHGFLKEYSKIQ